MSDFENKIVSDPSVSIWLKDQIEITKNIDPVDALNDVETLKAVLEVRFTENS